MRFWMIVIAIYLVISLVFPLYAMLSKSVSTYTFDLAQFEFQVSNEVGEFANAPVSALDLNEEHETVSTKELSTSSDGRLAATKFFPEFSFRSPVMYRVRGTSEEASYLVGSTLTTGTGWTELSSNEFPACSTPSPVSEGARELRHLFFHTGSFPVDSEFTLHRRLKHNYHGCSGFWVCLRTQP